jgi:hypothetical protein
VPPFHLVAAYAHIDQSLPGIGISLCSFLEALQGFLHLVLPVVNAAQLLRRELLTEL